jgi:hypothetical protein
VSVLVSVAVVVFAIEVLVEMLVSVSHRIGSDGGGVGGGGRGKVFFWILNLVQYSRTDSRITPRPAARGGRAKTFLNMEKCNANIPTERKKFSMHNAADDLMICSW